MKVEKYCFEFNEEDAQKTNILDYCFNENTKNFLQVAGLKPGMSVLDIGCGSGIMSCWIAEIVQNGTVFCIDNNEDELKNAERRAKENNISNITFELLSAYDIDKLKQSFDFIYCRFVLHHLHHPTQVIKKIFSLLKPKGIYASEEGIVNAAFTYPPSKAWGQERNTIDAYQDFEGETRDGNFGIKLYRKMFEVGFKNLYSNLYQPVLQTKTEKELLLPGFRAYQSSFLAEGHTEAEWQSQYEELQRIAKSEDQIIGFYQSMQVSGCR